MKVMRNSNHLQFALICPECPLNSRTPSMVIFATCLSVTGFTLIILKTLINPIIYACASLACNHTRIHVHLQFAFPRSNVNWRASVPSASANTSTRHATSALGHVTSARLGTRTCTSTTAALMSTEAARGQVACKWINA